MDHGQVLFVRKTVIIPFENCFFILQHGISYLIHGTYLFYATLLYNGRGFSKSYFRRNLTTSVLKVHKRKEIYFKGFASFIHGPKPLKMCMVGPDMCDYQICISYFLYLV